jgi:glycosyltransferase involved in cell wall biosynthesis
VIVSQNIGPRGGQDKANAALVRYLLDRGDKVILVCNTAAEEFMNAPNCETVFAQRLLDSDFLSVFNLARAAKGIVRRVLTLNPRARVVVNGGIFSNRDINWMHCVHHAWEARSPCQHASFKERIKHAIFRKVAKRRELLATRAARQIIANSKQTKRDVEQYLHKEPNAVVAIHLGADPDLIPPDEHQRTAAREFYGISPKQIAVVFVGALDRDDHKGFGCVFDAWGKLASQTQWNGKLLIADDGNQLPYWKEQACCAGLQDSIEFLGFVADVPRLLGAADLLVSPARYDGYGLNVQEAICRGVPTFVSRNAGVAERYPHELEFFLLDDIENGDELAKKFGEWQSKSAVWREAFAGFSEELRRYTWQDMARELVSAIEKS